VGGRAKGRSESTSDRTLGIAFILLVRGLTFDFSQAYITNASDYTLLSGTANVYVDGSFIARSVVPRVSSQESFSCPLGSVLLVSQNAFSPLTSSLQLGPLYPNHLPSHNQEALAVRLL
jgi:hypothetical protein